MTSAGCRPNVPGNNINQVLQFVSLLANLIEDDMIVYREGRTLKGDVGVQHEMPILREVTSCSMSVPGRGLPFLSETLRSR